MTTYNPPKQGAGYVTYIGLVSQADTKLLQVNPTIAAGDFKVSKDGGALANLGTLPAVDPAGSKLVKITLSATEMEAANVVVVASDQAGAEWCDQTFTLQPAVRQFDDLAYPATSGRSMVVDTNGLVDANTVKVGPTGSGTAQTAGDLTAQLTAIDNYVDTEVQAIKDKTDNLPSDPADASVIAGLIAAIDAKIDTIDNFLDTEVQAIKDKTDNLPTDPADASVIAGLISGLDTKLDTIDNFLDSEIADIKAKTDNLPSDPADQSTLASLITDVDNFVDTEITAIQAALTKIQAAVYDSLTSNGSTVLTLSNGKTQTFDADGNRTTSP